MSITRLEAPKRRTRRILVYDLEWVPRILVPRLAGFVDDDGAGGRGRYRAFVGEAPVRDFLDFALVKKYSGAYFYAHAGGLSDVQFLLEELIRRADLYDIQAVFSGSSAIVVKVRRGGSIWTFADSFWTLQASLAKIGKGIGMPKGEVRWTAPLRELIAYNEQDCRILQEALLLFQDAIIDLGSELTSTAAGTSLRLFRRQYLERPIRTCARTNREIRPGYAGGRTEPFRNRHHAGRLYDINSCYPHAMTFPLPGTKVGTGKKLPRGDRYCYAAKMTVRVPEMDLPPLPYTGQRSLYFPVGEWTGWFFGPEVELAEEVGVDVREVHKVHVFEQRTDHADFAAELYARRLRAKDTYLDQVLKILLNAQYGKYGEEHDKQGLVVNPSRDMLEELRDRAEKWRDLREARGVTAYPFDPYGRDGEWEHVPPVERVQAGVFIVREEVEVAHAHVALAGYVTSRGRATLYRYMRGNDPAYCDTDSFGTTREVPTSDELGGLKLEKRYEGVFHSPKLYKLMLPDGDPKAKIPPGGHLVKAKGFSRSVYYDREVARVEETDRREIAEGLRAIEEDLTTRPRSRTDPMDGGFEPHALDAEGFDRLVSGEDVWVRRMRRIRELYARGRTRPEEVDERKGLRGARPKRAWTSGGESRPWDVGELLVPFAPPGAKRRRAERGRVRPEDVYRGLLDAAGLSDPYLDACRRFLAWCAAGSRRGRDKPSWKGGELDALNRELDLAGALRVSSPEEGARRLARKHSARTWADVERRVLPVLREVPGLEALRVPDDASEAMLPGEWDREEEGES